MLAIYSGQRGKAGQCNKEQALDVEHRCCGSGGAGGDVQDQRPFKAVRPRCLDLEQRPSQAPAGFRHAGSRAVGDVRCLNVRCPGLAIGCDNTPRARVCSLVVYASLRRLGLFPRAATDAVSGWQSDLRSDCIPHC